MISNKNKILVSVKMLPIVTHVQYIKNYQWMFVLLRNSTSSPHREAIRCWPQKSHVDTAIAYWPLPTPGSKIEVVTGLCGTPLQKFRHVESFCSALCFICLLCPLHPCPRIPQYHVPISFRYLMKSKRARHWFCYRRKTKLISFLFLYYPCNKQ